MPKALKFFHRTGFIVSAVILFLVGILALTNLTALVANGQAVGRTLEIDRQLEHMSYLLIDAEMAQNAYLITGSQSDLLNYEQSLHDCTSHLGTLQTITQAQPKQQDLLHRLAPLVLRREQEMEAAAKARQEFGVDSGRSIALRTLRQNTLRQCWMLIDAMEDEQDRLLDKHTQQRDLSAQRSTISIVIGGSLAVALLSISSILRFQESLLRQRSEDEIRRLNNELETRVHQRTQHLELAQQQIIGYAGELEQARIEMLERLARAGEFRDDDTGQHTQRVGRTAGLLAARLGVESVMVDQIQQAARLHDLGKIGIPDSILLKPGPLTDEEYAVMKTHTTIGAALFAEGHSELMRIAQRIAQSHHERWDGRGYPQGLKADDIPLEARLLAVADVFDALTHERPYKKAWSTHEAVAEITRQSGAQFDPKVVEAFLILDHTALV